ncbi:hypothetical protein ACFLUU_00960 [Chloroflexota bacterium]
MSIAIGHFAVGTGVLHVATTYSIQNKNSADTKLVASWLVGSRNAGDAFRLMRDLQARLANRVQMTTDGHKAYLNTIEDVFDYAMLVKLYGKEIESETRYSPAKCIAAEPRTIQGKPDPAKISTSYAER